MDTDFAVACTITILLLSLQAHSAAVSDSCTKIRTSLESFADQGLKQAADDWKKELADDSDCVSEFTLTHRNKLEQAKRTVDNYVTNELLQDIPTGKSDLNRSLHCSGENDA